MRLPINPCVAVSLKPFLKNFAGWSFVLQAFRMRAASREVQK